MPFIDEITSKLASAGVGVKGSTILLASSAIIPTGDGPYLTVIETGGSAPTRVHNKNGANTQRPTAQITVRAKNYPPALAMARAAYNTLDGIFNTTLSGTFYQSITARQEPTDIGQDEAGRVMVVFNVEAEKQPS